MTLFIEILRSLTPRTRDEKGKKDPASTECHAVRPPGRLGPDPNGYPIVDALVEWISDLISVATVAGGVVTPGDKGMTTIRANMDGVSDTARV
jgi:hypothetical protein